MFKRINESFDRKFNSINDSKTGWHKRGMDRAQSEIDNPLKRTHKTESKSINESPVYDMTPQYDNRKSFYSKARVEDNGNEKTLYSYNTPVAKIVGDKVELLPKWDWSQTTLRHVKEFLKQNGFEANSLSQMRKDYATLTEAKNLNEAPIYDLTDDEIEFLNSRKTTRVDISDREAQLIDARRKEQEDNAKRDTDRKFRKIKMTFTKMASFINDFASSKNNGEYAIDSGVEEDKHEPGKVSFYIIDNNDSGCYIDYSREDDKFVLFASYDDGEVEPIAGDTDLKSIISTMSKIDDLAPIVTLDGEDDFNWSQLINLA